MAIAETMKLSIGEAEEAKRQMGFVTGDGYDPRIVGALTRPIERIVGETKRVLARYESEGSEKIAKVYLTGGGTALRGIVESFATSFGIPVVPANAFSKVAYPAFLEETLKEAGPAFAVAIGIALRRLIEK
jgi:Tfp pilus assembly PilM family ATPase